MGGWDGAGGGDGGMGGMVVGVGSDPGWDYLGGERADLFRAPSEVDFSSHYRKYETFWPNCQIEETLPICLEISQLNHYWSFWSNSYFHIAGNGGNVYFWNILGKSFLSWEVVKERQKTLNWCWGGKGGFAHKSRWGWICAGSQTPFVLLLHPERDAERCPGISWKTI